MDAIRTVLEAINSRLDEFLQNVDRRHDRWTALTNPMELDGSVNPEAQDKILLCLTNITHETIISTYSPSQGINAQHSVVSPPLYIDLHVAFIANFQSRSYASGLAALSRTISFFQQNPWFTQQSMPGLPMEIDKLTLEFTNLSPVDVNYVFGALGMKYRPAVFYKVRMIPFTAQVISTRAYPVRGEVQESPEHED